jgi:hypothetical protein
MAGIKNVEEVIAIVKLVVVETCKAVKDEGFQVADLTAALNAPEFQAKLEEAIDGVSELEAEVKDIGLLEGISLARQIQDLVTSTMAALKTPA